MTTLSKSGDFSEIDKIVYNEVKFQRMIPTNLYVCLCLETCIHIYTHTYTQNYTHKNTYIHALIATVKCMKSYSQPSPDQARR